MWSLGCIFSEMLTNNALFAGDSEIDQLFKIFHVLGTPTEEKWPGVTELPDFNDKFPLFAASNALVKKAGDFDIPKHFTDFLEELISYDPIKRLSAKEACNHKLFRS